MDALEQEMQRRGLMPKQETVDPLAAEMARRGLSTEQPEKKRRSTLQRARDSSAIATEKFNQLGQSIQGNAEFKGEGVTNYEDWSSTQKNFGFNSADIPTTAAGMFGTDEDKVNSFFKRHSQYPKQQDQNGNVYFVDPEQNNIKVYIDDPGLDAGDVADLVGQAGAFAVGGNVAQLAKPIVSGLTGASALADATLTGASLMGTDALLQTAAGRDEIDKGQMAMAGGIGFASPYIGKVFNWAKGKLSGGKANISKGQEMAKANGMKIDDKQAELLGKARTNIDKSVPDDALIAQYNHGLKLTRGEATGNIKQMKAENVLRTKPGLQDKFQQTKANNNANIESSLKQQRKSMYSGTGDDFEPSLTAGTAQDALIQAERTAKKAYVDEFQKVGKLAVKPEATNNLQGGVSKALKSGEVRLHRTNTPKANEAMEILNEEIMSKQGAISLDDYKQARGYVNSLYSNTMDKTDKRALTIIKKEYDDWFYNSVDDSLLSGDKGAVDQLLKARSMMTDYSKKFNSKDNVNKVIKTIVEQEKTAEEFSQMLFAVNGINKGGSANLVKAYGNAVGKDSEGFRALQAHVFERMVSKGGKIKGVQSLESVFNDAFKDKGKSLMRELYTQEQAVAMKSLKRSLGKLIIPDEVKNGSGSGQFVASVLQDSGIRLPVLTPIINAMKNLKGYGKASSMPKAPTPEVNAELLGAFQASNQNQ